MWLYVQKWENIMKKNTKAPKNNLVQRVVNLPIFAVNTLKSPTKQMTA